MERSRSGKPERRLDHLSRPHRCVQTSERSLTGSTRPTVIAKPATAAGPRIASMGGPGVPRACAARVRRADPRAWHRSDGSARPPASFSRHPGTTVRLSPSLDRLRLVRSHRHQPGNSEDQQTGDPPAQRGERGLGFAHHQDQTAERSGRTQDSQVGVRRTHPRRLRCLGCGDVHGIRLI